MGFYEINCYCHDVLTKVVFLLFLSILARTISIEGLLFLIFLAGLYFAFNIPIQNVLNRLLKGYKKVGGIIEILLFLVIARILAWQVEPFVSRIVDCAVDMIINALNKL